jgi:hypothetical protein
MASSNLARKGLGGFVIVLLRAFMAASYLLIPERHSSVMRESGE